MTVSPNDRIAMGITQCDFCKKLFIFEPYSIIYEEVESNGVKGKLPMKMCKKCEAKMSGKERKQSNMNEESRKFLDSLRDNVIRVEEDDSTCTAKIYIYDELAYTFTYRYLDCMDDELRRHWYMCIGDTAVRALISKWSKDAKTEEEKKQKTGKWQWSFNGKAILIQCSECGLHYDSWAVGFNYCPNCGAKMEEEEDGKIC